jgi:hypothetical protein
MSEKIFRVLNNNGAEKYKYFSAPFADIYLTNHKNIIKNYVLNPGSKLIK